MRIQETPEERDIDGEMVVRTIDSDAII